MSFERTLTEESLPGYEIGDEIGRGGWGVVFQGVHRSLGRRVAIKQLPPAFAGDATVRSRFVAEARLVASLDHPHIVPVHDYVEREGVCLLVMEYLAGGSLWDRFQAEGVTTDRACAVALAVCAALEHAHRRDILHRDVKPENVMFNEEGVPKLGDFGIAKVLNQAATVRTAVGATIGTPAYMSPEQATNQELSPATDVYSTAVMLYELLCGDLPFEPSEELVTQLYQHVHEEPRPLRERAPEVPASIAEVVMRALEKRPEDRYASAGELGVALAEGATAEFGAGWLRGTSVRVTGDPDIMAVVERDTPSPLAPVAPTLVRGMPGRVHQRLEPEMGEEQPEGGEPGTAPPPPAPAASPADRTGGAAEPSTGSPVGSQAESSADPRRGPTSAGSPPDPPDSGGSGGGSGGGPDGGDGPAEGRPRRRLAALGAAAVAVVAAAAVAVVVAAGGDGGEEVADDVEAEETTTVVERGEGSDDEGSDEASGGGEEAERETPYAEIEEIRLEDGRYVIDYDAVGFTPLIDDPGAFHVHFYWDTLPTINAGANGPDPGSWLLWDTPFTVNDSYFDVDNRPSGTRAICVVIADNAHNIADVDGDGSVDTGTGGCERLPEY